MKKLYVSQSLIDVESRKELLDQATIPCTIKNQRSAMLGGEVPFAEVFPELWVLQDEDLERAQQLLQDWEDAPPIESTSWTCGNCSERHQKEFTTCWKCGHERSSEKKHIFAPIESFKEDLDQNAFKRYFPQGLLVGIFLTWASLAAWDYFSMTHNYQDRNRDGKEDYRETRKNTLITSDQRDDNFDGIYETRCEYNASQWTNKCFIDRNQDGEPNFIEGYTFGALYSKEFLDLQTGKVRKRAYYKLGVKVREKIDEDGDGIFEKTIHFNQYEDPISSNP